MLELKPKLRYRWNHLQFELSSTFRNYKVDGERLYKENFHSFTMLYRKNKRISHRFLYLDDTTEKDVDRWLGDALAREQERTLEYTLIWQPSKPWTILTGIKLGWDYNSDVDESDLTNREVYLKVARKF